MVTAPTDRPVDLGNESVLVRYYAELRAASEIYHAEHRAPNTPGLQMDPGLPELTAPLANLLAPATMRMVALADIGGCHLRLLDLRGNPGTRTTKTFASLLIVARAVAHIRRTGERIMLVTPTSGNKGTALRDAVLRAVQLGLVEATELSVAMVAPMSALPKLWSSPLSTDPDLLRRNPVLLYEGPTPDHVKGVTAEFVRASAEQFRRRRGVHLWYTLDLANYIVADTARAFFEADTTPSPPGHDRVHAHSVSSAFGLLGYHLGRRARWRAADPDHPQFLLVQHLRTPDMVVDLLRAQANTEPPQFVHDAATGGYTQSGDPHYPSVTDDPTEELDSTFYTRKPATSPTMNNIIGRYGGSGIVVSGRECRTQYEELRRSLAEVDIELPSDSAKLREWSLVMALTGVRNAIERGLLPEGAEVVVHASGSYSADDYEPLPTSCTTPVRGPTDLVAPLEKAVL